MKQKIVDIAKEMEPELIAIRRELHQYPETALNEKRTAEIIARELKKIPQLTVYENMAEGTGVVAILEGKKGPGKCRMLRADIDALPVEEMVESPWKSKNPGCMHACGHDAHATWVIGAAKILSALQEELTGTVKFVFQPGEECGKGARALIEKDHILENPKVDAAFAGHAWPTIEAGKIGIARKYAFGCPGGFEIKIHGAGGHGSWPYLCKNPITVATQIYTALQQIVAERINSVEPRVISVGSIHAGKPGVGNIIPDDCVMNGTFRATKAEVMEEIIDDIRRVSDGIAKANQVECEVKGGMHDHAVVNDAALVNFVQNCATDVLGEGKCFVIEEPHLGGENFALYSSRVPGCYIFVGIKQPGAEEFGLHSPIFRIAEEVLAPAAAVFADVIMEYQ